MIVCVCSQLLTTGATGLGERGREVCCCHWVGTGLGLVIQGFGFVVLLFAKKMFYRLKGLAFPPAFGACLNCREAATALSESHTLAVAGVYAKD